MRRFFTFISSEKIKERLPNITIFNRNMIKSFGVKNSCKIFKSWLNDYISTIWGSIDTRIVGVMSGFASLLWALFLFGQPQLFDHEIYQHFAKLARQETWGYFTLILGTIQFCSATQTSIKVVALHLAISFIASMFWLFTVFATVMVHPISPAVAVYSVFALGTVWDFIRVKVR